MTRIYEWKPMPHRLDVVCPNCRHRAEFEFAEVVRIKQRSDVEFFQKSSMFEYQEFQDSCGHFWHGAVYFQGLHGDPRKTMHELPLGYSAADWDHANWLRSRADWPVGSVRCTSCHLRQVRVLKWPEDAYFSLTYRRHALWAFHRESAIDLMEYLLSTKRNVSQYRWSYFLRHVPTVFKVGKARDTLVKQLSKLLDTDGARHTGG